MRHLRLRTRSVSIPTRKQLYFYSCRKNIYSNLH